MVCIERIQVIKFNFTSSNAHFMTASGHLQETHRKLMYREEKSTYGIAATPRSNDSSRNWKMQGSSLGSVEGRCPCQHLGFGYLDF